jgi:hypothetical protein
LDVRRKLFLYFEVRDPELGLHVCRYIVIVLILLVKADFFGVVIVILG